jgi:hypothetical protein
VEGLSGQGVELFGRGEALISGLDHHLPLLNHVHELDPLCSAIIALPPSHHLLFQPIFVVQTTKDETDRDPQMQWKPVPVVLQQSWQG